MEPPGLGEFELEQPAPPSPAAPPWPPAARWAVGCGSGCAAMVLLEALLMLAGVSLTFSQASGIAAKVQAPASVVEGETFPLRLVVKNEGTKPLGIANVALRSSTLAV